VSQNDRGIFDGQSPPSTTFIFDPSIFDTLLQVPIGKNEIIALVHGNAVIETPVPSMDTIIVKEVV